VATVDVYLLGSRSGLAAPESYRVEYWSGGAWRDASVRSRVPARPTAWARNRIVIEPVVTDGLRVVFAHARPAVTGVTELVLWGQ
jgi:hypothetical protein